MSVNYPKDGGSVLEIKVGPEQVRVLMDPFDKESKSRAIACVPVSSLLECGLGNWLEANVRLQKMSGRIARDIQDTLVREPDKMHPLNRGLTVLAKAFRYDTQQRALYVTLSNPKRHGLIDGGHTFRAIEKVTQEREKNHAKDKETPGGPPHAFVNLEVLVGYDEIASDIISARNSVCQVRDSAIYALEGVFDDIKGILKNEKMLSLVSFKQNEETDDKPVSIEEVIAIATLFHPQFADGANNPTRAYTSRASCVEAYADEFNMLHSKEKPNPTPWLNGYGKIIPIIPEILRLSECVELGAHEAFRSAGGLKGLLGEEDDNGDPEGRGKGRKLKEFAGPRDLPFTKQRTACSWPTGYLYPIIASLRPLVDYSGNVAQWKVKDPSAVFKQCSVILVKTLFEFANEFGRKPNAVGKNNLCWKSLYDTVDRYVLKQKVNI